MSQHTPWSQEEAEKWADEYVSGWWAEPLVQARARVDFKAGLAKAAEFIENSPTKQIIVETLKNHTKEMEGYRYFSSNPGVSEDDYEEIADEIVAQLVGVRPIERGKTDGE